MRLYQKLSKIGFLKKSYTYKFLFVAFIGIHIPLIGLLFFVMYGNNVVSHLTILFVALLLTLTATGVTLFILRSLMKPIEMASLALSDYRSNRKISKLPTFFYDEAGLLMRNIQESIQENETFIHEKQNLIYMLSHDLRSFGGNSQALSTLILNDNPSDSIKEYANLINSSMTQQNHFIENFIKLLKEQDDSVDTILEPKTIHIPSLFTLVNEQVRQKMKVKSIELITKIEINEANLLINEELLIRVLVNLIDNAVKFSFSNSEIHLKIHLENHKVFFEVSDNGIGFEKNDRELLFEKFTKMGKMGTLNEPSTGIGLYLCRETVEKYNGKLIAESNGINKGSKFSIIFKN